MQAIGGLQAFEYRVYQHIDFGARTVPILNAFDSYRLQEGSDR